MEVATQKFTNFDTFILWELSQLQSNKIALNEV